MKVMNCLCVSLGTPATTRTIGAMNRLEKGDGGALDKQILLKNTTQELKADSELN